MSRREAIEHAAGVRLRPILMTTAAMVVGMIPLIIADGAGARSRFDIGLVIARRHERRHDVHAVRDAGGLYAAVAPAREGRAFRPAPSATGPEKARAAVEA